MSFLAHWQPLRDEDAHTALVFGFLRHAPRGAALDPWLAQTLGRPVVAAGLLERQSFWPTLPSVVAGSLQTVPELVFAADDGAPLMVVVEVKPGYEMHTIEQIAREIIDVAQSREAGRIACVMVGADLARPASSSAWLARIRDQADAQDHGRLELELHYSSFADLGKAIEACGRHLPGWEVYAADVNAQLRRKGLLGYEGAPMYDDLEGLTTANAVDLFNRTIRAARQFYLQLHSQSEFTTLELEPPDWNYRMLRDGRSEVPTQAERWFETTVLVSLYKHPALPEQTRLLVAFDLLGSGTGHADLLAGLVSYTSTDAIDVYALAQAIRDTEPVSDNPPWTERKQASRASWLLDRRPWQPATPSEDIAWTLTRLHAAIAAVSSADTAPPAASTTA